MTMPFVTPQSSGASAGVRVPEPAVDLAALVQHLAGAIRPLSLADPRHPAADRPFITWDAGERVLTMDTHAVLFRLWARAAARQAMRAFLVDAEVPKTRARAYLGGVIKPGSELALRDATKNLVDGIDGQVEAAMGAGFDPALLATTPAASVLETLGQRVGSDPAVALQGPTRISRTLIGAVPETQERRRDEIARVMSAVEEVEGTRETHIRNFFASVEPRLLAEGYSPGKVTAALGYHSQNAQKSGTQLARFFDFLEGDALSRVRVEVGSHVMETLGHEAEQRRRKGIKGDWALLASYVRRAAGMLELLRSPRTPALRVNLSAEFGQSGSFNLRDEAITAGFVTCLPVWPEWKTQMFEEQFPPSTSAGGPTISRELTYRFRVNGVVPGSGETSFVTRLKRIERDWLRLTADTDQAGTPGQRVARSLAEVVFLWAAIPEGDDTPADPAQALDAARRLAQLLEQEGRPAIEEVMRDLHARSGIMQRIARALTALLRERGTVLTRSVSGRRWSYYVNVLPGVVDMQRIGDELADPLACGPQAPQEQIDFLRHIWITREESLTGALLSIKVQVRLMERSLYSQGVLEVVETRRVPPENLVQAVWRPAALRGQDDLRETLWLVSPRVEVLYDTGTVGWQKERATKPEDLHGLAATRSALAILVHTTLLRLAQHAAAAAGRRPTFSVLRLQERGRDPEGLGGEEAIYAAAQAVEIALGRDVDARMQGVSLDADEEDNRYRRRGAYAALFAGFPLQFSQPWGERPPAGVITFATRPCNDHPDLPTAQGLTLVLARSYLASPIDSPFVGYDLRTLGNRTELCDPSVALPDTVAEEIERMYNLGCRHIILISHRFGRRRVGGGAAHPRLLEQGETIARLTQSHPDLTLYPLVRDLFHATRIRQRDHHREDAFEVLRVSDHAAGIALSLPEEHSRLRRRYEPVYSLATLHVVGGEEAATVKPQSGFCTYFLLRDGGTIPAEVRVRIEGNLLGDDSPVRATLLAVLRGLHYLEAERAAAGHVQPVLDPYSWMTPDTVGKVGEVLALPPSRRRGGSVGLSLAALLNRTSRTVHGLPRPGASPGDASAAPPGARTTPEARQ
jgi:hypothetical protein